MACGWCPSPPQPMTMTAQATTRPARVERSRSASCPGVLIRESRPLVVGSSHCTVDSDWVRCRLGRPPRRKGSRQRLRACPAVGTEASGELAGCSLSAVPSSAACCRAPAGTTTAEHHAQRSSAFCPQGRSPERKNLRDTSAGPSDLQIGRCAPASPNHAEWLGDGQRVRTAGAAGRLDPGS